MPQMTSLTVNDSYGTTQLFTQQQPSAGDNQPAIWKNEAIGVVLAGRPSFSLVARNNGTKRARRLTASFLFPKVRTDVTGNVTVVGGASCEASFLIPQDMTAAEIAETVTNFTNLLASPLIRDCVKTGYAAS